MYVATGGEPTFARRESGSYVYTNHQTMWWTIDTKLGQKSSTQEKNKKKKYTYNRQLAAVVVVVAR